MTPENDDEDDRDSSDELVHEALQERTQVARYLRAIADGIESGMLRLTSGDKQLEFRPPTLCAFELRAKSDRSRAKLRLRLAWRKADDHKPSSDLRIDTQNEGSSS